MYGKLLILCLAAVAVAADLPTFQRFDCNPCANPGQFAELLLPAGSRWCFGNNEPVFRWPSKENCPLPTQFFSRDWRLEQNGIVYSHGECVGPEQAYPYEINCNGEWKRGIFRVQHMG